MVFKLKIKNYDYVLKLVSMKKWPLYCANGWAWSAFFAAQLGTVFYLHMV